MRYLLRKCGLDGVEEVGMSNTLIGTYASDRNARRYMAQRLRDARFDAGQYLLQRWPVGDPYAMNVVGHLYKQAPAAG